MHPTLSSKGAKKCNVITSFQIFDVEGFLPLAFVRILETQKRSHLDSDEQQTLKKYQLVSEE